MTGNQPYIKAETAPHPVSAMEWWPHFERLFADYTMGQEGAVTRYDVRSLFEYMAKAQRGKYPSIETEKEETHVRKLLYGFLANKFGPLFDGTVYHEHKSRGRSILVGTDDAMRLIAAKRG